MGRERKAEANARARSREHKKDKAAVVELARAHAPQRVPHPPQPPHQPCTVAKLALLDKILPHAYTPGFVPDERELTRATPWTPPPRASRISSMGATTASSTSMAQVSHARVCACITQAMCLEFMWLQ